MLALLYLAIATCVGDHLCRCFYSFVSGAHRWAAATLVGLLLSAWFTYLAAWNFICYDRPLVYANITFLISAAGTLYFIRRRRHAWFRRGAGCIQARATGSELWDWGFLVIYALLASWMMFATLNYKDGNLLVGNNQWSDFGPNTAIIQSFAVGHNFPTEYPHFSGEPIRYHFLFYFLAGNLVFLGIKLPWTLNLLSILTLTCMLALVMALGQLLFRSRAVGRIGSALFFFHGTLSFVPFLLAQPSVAEALSAIYRLREFLPSGYPYRGELWGVWTQIVFLNQRHLASGIGILLIVLLFLIDKYQREIDRNSDEAGPAASEAPPSARGALVQPWSRWWNRSWTIAREPWRGDRSFIFAGVLLGALPYWNALVFTAAFAVLAVLFVFFPCRRYMIGLGATAAVVALPQLVLLQRGGAEASHALWHWGYIVDPPTLRNVFGYFGFMFGLKTFLMLIAFVKTGGLQRRLFLAMCSLVAITFCLRLSIETLANHKFLNIWLIVGNLFAGFALVLLWRWSKWRLTLVSRAIAVLLLLAIGIGGLIDLFPIRNGYYVSVKYRGDRLVKWLRAQTGPKDVFLSDRFVNHQILLAGRRLFYGWPSFAWSAGYKTTERDVEYRELFETSDPRRAYALLQKHRIKYVAVDDGVRRGQFIRHANEQLYAQYFPKVFDARTHYAALTIYRVLAFPPAEFEALPPFIPSNLFIGGSGTQAGEFNRPRGLAVDPAGNVYVSDSGNRRVQVFSPEGVFQLILGNGAVFEAPDGLAVDNGVIYVADAFKHKVFSFSLDGRLLAAWPGPAPGFYGPRDVTITGDGSIYVVDQGHARIVVFGRDGTVRLTWGARGEADGEFIEPTSVAVDERAGRVYVADPRNSRIQVFDMKGAFLTKWPVDEWRRDAWILQDLVLDTATQRLYASSFATREVLCFDSTGQKLASLKGRVADSFDGASALQLSGRKLYVLNTFGNRVDQIDLPER